MRRLDGSILGPWPLRPFWMFVLLATVQNYGIGDARLITSNAAWDDNVVGFGLERVLLSLLLAATAVAVMWMMWALTALRGRRQPVWAYILMLVAGAVGTVAFRAVTQALQGIPEQIPGPAAVFVHYVILIFILQTSIGVIGSRVSESAQRAEEALAKLNEQERRFVVSEERARRIAAEFLHDRVQADLLVIAMELRRVAEDAPEGLARRIASITESVETVRLSDVRDTSRSLSPLVQATGLASALTVLADRWAPAMRVSVHVSPGIGALDVRGAIDDPDRALGIYRIVEQALLNAAAHGRAEQAQVSITEQMRGDRPYIRVHVTDDGAGFDPGAASTGGGFATSQVWARLLDGDWSIASQPGRGATVIAWIPRD